MKKLLKEQNLKLALVSQEGWHQGKVFPLLSERQLIGRRIDAAIPIYDLKASRDHAVVDHRNGFCYLVDLGSTNGTYVNGQRLRQSSRLKIGDEVSIASARFKVDLLKRWKNEDRLLKTQSESSTVFEEEFSPAKSFSSLQEAEAEEATKMLSLPEKSKTWLQLGFVCFLLLIIFLAVNVGRIRF